MEAVILAGGFGTRLREVIPDLPKPMAPVAGLPFLEILLRQMSKKGFTRVILSLGHMSDKIVAHFGDTFEGIELIYEIEEEPLGTGGAVRAALDHCHDDHIYIFNGDTFLDLETETAEQYWHSHETPIIVAREVPDTMRFGRLDINNGRVTGFMEKGISGPGLINAGCYIFPRKMLDEFVVGKPFSLETDFLLKTVSQNPFNVFVTKGHFIDIGVPEDYERAQTELVEFIQ